MRSEIKSRISSQISMSANGSSIQHTCVQSEKSSEEQGDKACQQCKDIQSNSKKSKVKKKVKIVKKTTVKKCTRTL